MGDREVTALHALVTGVQNRLWMSTLRRWVVYALWVAALLLIAAGLFHLFYRGLPPSLVWLAALIPLGLALLAALLFGRPGPAEASRRADRWAGAESLLLSAWEISSQPRPKTSFAPLAMLRAARSAPQWQERIDRHRQREIRGHPIMALTAGLFGALLLYAPGDPGRLPAATAPAAGLTPLATGPATTPQPLAEAIASLATQRPDRDLVPEPSDSAPGAADSLPGQPSKISAPEAETGGSRPEPQEGPRGQATARPHAPAAGGPPATVSGSSSVRLAATGGQTSAGGDKAGLGSGSSGPRPASVASDIEIAVIDIARRPVKEGTQRSGEQTVELAAADRPGHGERNPGPVAPARLAEELNAVNRFTPAERHYIARYFESLHSGESQ